MDKEFAIGVVGYEYHSDVILHVLKMTEFCEHILFFDNSESKKTHKIRNKLIDNKSVQYFTKNSNIGLAGALNFICNSAIQQGFEWILLLDQDGEIDQEFMNQTLLDKNNIEHIDQIGAIGPLIDDKSNRAVKHNSLVEKDVIITSGMLLNLKAYAKTGVFSTDLFLDEVDYDYCLRLKRKGFRILQNGNVVLRHNKFDHQKKMDGYKINKYSTTRIYYLTRNHWYMIRTYKDFPHYIAYENKLFWWKIQHVARYDTNKFIKTLAFLLGSFDYLIGQFGKCKWRFK